MLSRITVVTKSPYLDIALSRLPATTEPRTSNSKHGHIKDEENRRYSVSFAHFTGLHLLILNPRHKIIYRTLYMFFNGSLYRSLNQAPTDLYVFSFSQCKLRTLFKCRFKTFACLSIHSKWFEYYGSFVQLTLFLVVCRRTLKTKAVILSSFNFISPGLRLFKFFSGQDFELTLYCT